MNLGQLIGELMARAEGFEQRAAMDPAQPSLRVKPVRVIGIHDIIRAVLDGAPKPIGCAEIARLSGNPQVTANKVFTNIGHIDGVVRSGERGTYKYALKAA